jgi:hypothetical protein
VYSFPCVCRNTILFEPLEFSPGSTVAESIGSFRTSRHRTSSKGFEVLLRAVKVCRRVGLPQQPWITGSRPKCSIVKLHQIETRRPRTMERAKDHVSASFVTKSRVINDAAHPAVMPCRYVSPSVIRRCESLPLRFDLKQKSIPSYLGTGIVFLARDTVAF